MRGRLPAVLAATMLAVTLNFAPSADAEPQAGVGRTWFVEYWLPVEDSVSEFTRVGWAFTESWQGQYAISGAIYNDRGCTYRAGMLPVDRPWVASTEPDNEPQVLRADVSAEWLTEEISGQVRVAGQVEDFDFDVTFTLGTVPSAGGASTHIGCRALVGGGLGVGSVAQEAEGVAFGLEIGTVYWAILAFNPMVCV